MAGSQTDVLIPVSPDMAIEEIVARVWSLHTPHVELLVPDNTKALQSLAGCETLQQAASSTGIHLTLFTADEQTTEAAGMANLEVIGVGGSILAPTTPMPEVGDRGSGVGSPEMGDVLRPSSPVTQPLTPAPRPPTPAPQLPTPDSRSPTPGPP